MATPFILVTTRHVEPEQLAEYTELSRHYTEFVQATEPCMLAHYAHSNDNQTQVSPVQTHPDTASADFHPQLAGERISQAPSPVSPGI